MIRAAFGSASALAPTFSARVAERLFLTPPRSRLLPGEVQALARGTYRAIAFREGSLATWTFGEGPAVLLAHGWGGHSGRLCRFIEPLVRAGFSVVTFDAPGHGLSTGGASSMLDFAAAIETLVRAEPRVAGLIGHSLGASAAALAVRTGLPIPRLVLLAPPANPEQYAAKFARHLGIPAPVCDRMKRLLTDRYAVGWSDIRIDSPVADSPSRILVVHDRADARVPWREGAAIAAAWPGAELVSTKGLGHHKILRDPDVVLRSVAFLSDAPPRRTLPEVSARRRRGRALRVNPGIAIQPATS
jgi:pimeloyl-ACP methyl ester carboxylesterase